MEISKRQKKTLAGTRDYGDGDIGRIANRRTRFGRRTFHLHNILDNYNDYFRHLRLLS